MEFKTAEEAKVASVMFEILEGLLNPNLVCDQKGRIIFANRKYRELSHKKPENRLFWKTYPLTDKIPGYFEKAVDQCTETCSEITNNENSFIVRVIPINNIIADNLLFMVYFENITSQILMTHQLKIDKRLLQNSFLDTILAFSHFIESRDPYTSGHQKRVALLSLNIASRANIKDSKTISTIYYGALMHDIGKVAIPMEYLVRPRRLTEYEYEIMKTHVAIGNKIIEHMEFPWDIKSVVYQHHERMDGSGYPNGIKGDEITIPARIVTIADVFEAMSTNRPYRSLLPDETILQYFRENKDKLFDGYFVDCFLKCYSELEDVYEMSPNFTPSDFFNF